MFIFSWLIFGIWVLFWTNPCLGWVVLSVRFQIWDALTFDHIWKPVKTSKKPDKPAVIGFQSDGGSPIALLIGRWGFDFWSFWPQQLLLTPHVLAAKVGVLFVPGSTHVTCKTYMCVGIYLRHLKMIIVHIFFTSFNYIVCSNMISSMTFKLRKVFLSHGFAARFEPGLETVDGHMAAIGVSSDAWHNYLRSCIWFPEVTIWKMD